VGRRWPLEVPIEQSRVMLLDTADTVADEQPESSIP